MKKDTKKDNEVLKDLIAGNLQKEESITIEQSDVMEDSIEDVKVMPEEASKRPTKHSSDKTGEELTSTLSNDTRKLLQLRAGRKRQKPVTEEYIRTSFVIRGDQMEKLRLMSIRENISLKAIVEEAFRSCIEKYESKYGVLVVKHQKKKEVADLFSD